MKRSLIQNEPWTYVLLASGMWVLWYFYVTPVVTSFLSSYPDVVGAAASNILLATVIYQSCKWLHLRRKI